MLQRNHVLKSIQVEAFEGERHARTNLAIVGIPTQMEDSGKRVNYTTHRAILCHEPVAPECPMYDPPL